ncbi:N-acetylmuramoyl-L-alanine amidase family 2 protein [Lentilactobacillus senioris DSM 24302 = JCM 17472]|uniref:N-acetylmuramoyl-L-alanine amidase family 2 protein n=1 Tax=Lentilactobacillus senioris DSM 24302 = JCM 17472 TaxID=1423802 RepID=A0A0R2CPU3_9LACO|nr:N-acetylmuramoyl-L-alanine amidase [Lentilactobacillus senioris]KRM93258.1 N-acetylmuramoyl-L-alanine amidase family 2 protein [Lentilactobacillus senioris DSM 24302 = JCM 17472]
MKKGRIITSLAALGFATVAMFGFGQTANASSSAVNNYIKSHNISHAKVTSSVWSGFPKNKYRHGKGKPEGVVVHETANNSSTLFNEVAFMKRNYQNAFVHTFVDASRIVNIANTNYLSWGAGYPANARYVQFEQVRVHSKSAFAHEVANAAYYTAYILDKYNLKPNDAAYDGKGTVWAHYSVAKFLGGSNHSDPVEYYSATGKKYFGAKYTMAQFYTLVKEYYNDIHSTSGSINANSKKNVKYAKVSYSAGSGNEIAKLSSKKSSYVLYNHVKNSQANVKSYKWPKNAKTNTKVYVDAVGKKSTTTWYRIRFSASTKAKRYWVYSGALKFANVNYTDSTARVTVKSGINDSTRNHVFNSSYLSKKVTKLSNIAGQTFNADKLASMTDLNGKTKNYYRINVNGKSQWIYANHVTVE